MNKILFNLLVFLSCSIVLQAQEKAPKREFRGVWISTINNIDFPSSPHLSLQEQQAEFTAQVDLLKHKIQELQAAKNGLSGKSTEPEGEEIDLGAAGEMDVLGFTADQWLETFSNLENLEDAIGAASMGVQGFMNAWSMYHELVSANERKELAEFERNNNRKKERQKSLLDNGLINQRQYDDAIKALEIEADKRKAEMEYKLAKRAWTMQLTSAIANTAMAVLNGLNTAPFMPLGIAMGALAGVLGGVQIATIAKNKPVKGFEKGLYPITREQDGKKFIQLESALGSVVLNLDKFFRLNFSQPMVSFLNLSQKERTKFFMPIKKREDYELIKKNFIVDKESYLLVQKD